MNLKVKLYLLAMFACLVWAACRKTDAGAVTKETKPDDKFFNSHAHLTKQ